MKQFTCLVCLFALLLSACTVTDQTPSIPTENDTEENYTHGVYQLTFHAKNISNHGVGNDWSFTYTHKGQTITNGYTITQSLEIFTFQRIDVEILETDKYDDIGTGTLDVGIYDGSVGKTQITVTESHGIYKGNTAVWEIRCEVKEICRKHLNDDYLYPGSPIL